MKIVNLSLALALIMSGCQVVSVDADQEGVFIKKPWLFGNGGVDTIPLTSGSCWKVRSTDFIPFYVSPILFTENFDDIMSDGNTPVDLSASILLKIKKGETPKLIMKFGHENWYAYNIQKEFRRYVRDEISKHKLFDLTSNREIYVNIEKIVLDNVRLLIESMDMPIDAVSVVVDRAKPNKGVMDEIDRTAIEEQAQKTEEQKKLKEEFRKQSEMKRAEADKAYQNEMNLTADQYIRLRGLEIEKEKIEMIKGKQNVSVSILMGGEAFPTYSLNK